MVGFVCVCFCVCFVFLCFFCSNSVAVWFVMKMLYKLNSIQMLQQHYSSSMDSHFRNKFRCLSWRKHNKYSQANGRKKHSGKNLFGHD